MKKILVLVAAALLFSNISFAQQEAGDKSIGVQANYADYNSGASLGVKFTYAINKNFRLAPNANYTFKSENVSSFDINADLHYLISVGSGDKMAIYPLGGLTFQSWKLDDQEYYIGSTHVVFEGETTNKFGLNLGCGFQYQINDQWRPFAEAKHVFVSDFNQFIFSVGMAYHF